MLEELKKLLFSLKNKIFNEETLEYYDKYQNIFEVVNNTCFYKILSYDNFVKKMGNSYLTMKKTLDFPKSGDLVNYYDDKTVLLSCKTDNDKIIKFGEKYVFFTKFEIIDKLEIGNYILFNIKFLKRPNLLEIIFQENLTNSFSKIFESNNLLFLCEEEINNCNMFVFTTDKLEVRVSGPSIKHDAIEFLSPPQNFSEMLPFYQRYNRKKGYFYQTDEDIMSIIKKLLVKNYKNCDNIKDQIFLTLLTEKKIWKILRDKYLEKNVEIYNPYPRKKVDKNEIYEWGLSNYLKNYECCDKSFEYSTRISWPIMNFLTKKKKIHPYYEYFQNSMIKSFENSIPPPVGLTIFRGIEVENRDELRSLDESFSSFSIVLSVPNVFAPINYSSTIIFYHKISDPDLKVIYVDNKFFKDKPLDQSQGELIFPNYTRFHFGKEFKFGVCKFIEITKIEILDVNRYLPIDYSFEKLYHIEEIISKKNCYLTFRIGRLNEYVINFFYNKEYFDEKEIYMIKNIKYMNINVKKIKYGGKYLDFQNPTNCDITFKNQDTFKFNIIQIENYKLRKFLVSNFSREDFLNFVTKNYVKNQFNQNN